MVDVAVPRFPAARGAHYESFYVRAWDPDVPRAIWIRSTMHQGPGAPASGALWVTAFEPDGVTAFRRDGLPAAPGADRRWISVGDATISEPVGRTLHLAGSLDAEGHHARWDLTLRAETEPWLHLAPALLYRAPIPRTKSTSPMTDARATGSVEIDGVTRTYRAAMLGHNWGSEHAHRWIWIHGADDDGNVVDLVGGRLKIAGRVLPWRISGMVAVRGERRRVGGITARADVDADEQRCRFAVSGVRGEITAGPLARWVYDDPAGGTHDVTNSSTAHLQIAVDGRTIELRAAAYELGVTASAT
jgi:hypothetical protein